MTTATTASTTPTTLERRLGSFDAAAIIVSNVIGGGILFTPPLIAAHVPHPWWFLGAWMAGGRCFWSPRICPTRSFSS